MTTQTFSVGESIAFGWREVTGRLGLWLGVMLAFIAAVIGPELIAALLGQTGRPLGLVLGFAGILLHALVQVGLIDLALRAVDGREVRVELLFGRSDLLLRYFIASIFFGLAVAVGMIFLVIPGLIVLVLFFFYGHQIVSEDAGIGAAFEGSMDVTKGRRLEVFLLLVLLAAINVIGALAFLVGLLVTVPLAAVAAAQAFRGLQAFHGHGRGPVEMEFGSGQGFSQ